MSKYADIRNEMVYRDANNAGMYDLCEDILYKLEQRDAEIGRLRELLVRCVPLIPQHWELGPNGKMTAKELEKEVSDDF
jgi:hypothetical protein